MISSEKKKKNINTFEPFDEKLQNENEYGKKTDLSRTWKMTILGLCLLLLAGTGLFIVFPRSGTVNNSLTVRDPKSGDRNGGGGGGGGYNPNRYRGGSAVVGPYEHLFVAESKEIPTDFYNKDFYSLLNDIPMRPIEEQVGIAQKGNSCYAASSLQLLFRIPVIRKLVANLDIYREASAAHLDRFVAANPELKVEVKTSHREEALKITQGLNHMFHQLQSNSNGKAAKFSFKHTMKCMPDQFAGYEQQDADEYISHIIGHIQELIPPSQTQGLFMKFKQIGQIHSIQNPKRVERRERGIELHQISLPIENDQKTNLETLLGAFFAEDEKELNFDDGTPGQANDKIYITSLPDHLLIHLKRLNSIRNEEGKFVHSKWSQRIKVPEEINFAQFVHRESKKLIGSTKYRLKVFITHHGGADGGHYTATDYQNKVVFDDSNTYPLDDDLRKDEAYIYLYESIQIEQHQHQQP
jgi:ubiquitin C-terminal hydrolase